MISKDNTQVFGVVSKDVKKRIKRISKRKREWSESRMIREGLLRLLAELEEQFSPTHKPRRKNNAA